MDGRLTRAEQTRLTTERIYASLVDEVVERGWDGVTATSIAKRAGVTVGAIYSRAESVSELANLVWSEQLRQPFEAAVRSLIAAARSGSIDDFSSSATAFDRYARANTTVFDLAIASLFDDELADVVERDIQAFFTGVIDSTEGVKNSATHSAATALLLCFFMGRALAIRSRRRAPKLDVAQLTVISSYWSAPHLDIAPDEVQPVRFLRDDETRPEPHIALYRGVLEVLAKRGYRRATIARIGRATGMTPGAVLTSHPTKALLVVAAANALVNSPGEVWAQYAPVIGALGPLRARAAFLATFLDRQHAPQWKLNIELARVAEFIPELSSFRTPNNTLEHTHLGVMFVACFVPGMGRLPFAGPFSMGSAT